MLGQAHEPTEGAEPFYGWRLVFVLMFVYMAGLSFPYFGAGVMNAAMAKALGMNRSVLGMAFSLVALFTGLPGPLVAWTIGRFGARYCIVGGTLTIAIAAALIATVVSSSWSFILLFGVVLGSGVAFSTSIPAQATVAQWFARKRAPAMSLLLISVGAGAIVASFLLGHVVASTGNWRTGWWVISGVALVAALVAGKFVVDEPADIGQVQDGLKASVQDGVTSNAHNPASLSNWTIRSAARTSAFWIIAICATAYYLPMAVTLAHLAVHILDLGFSAEVGTHAFGLIGLGQMIGKVIVGWLGDRFSLRRMWAAAMLLMACALVIVLNPSRLMIIYVAALAMGIGQGISLVVFPTMLANYFGHSAFVRLSGVTMPMVTIVISIAPYLAGASYDHSGNYGAAFMTIAAILLCAGPLVLFARAPGAPHSIDWRRRQTAGSELVPGAKGHTET